MSLRRHQFILERDLLSEWKEDSLRSINNNTNTNNNSTVQEADTASQ